jgi:hypothetical protein
MRATPNSNVERYRLTEGPMGSDARAGNNGCFFIPCPGTHASLQVIVSDGMGWEHVSVSLRTRCPTWSEMCYIKDLFWDEESTVMQLHPPRSKWVNNHPYCLHLWKPVSEAIRCPPEILVGVRSAGTLQP